MSTNDTAQAGATDNASLPVTIRLTSGEIDEAQFLARQDHRSRAAFLRLIYLRGLTAYKKELESETA